MHLPRLLQLELLFSLGDKEQDPISDELIRALSLPNPAEPGPSGLLPRLDSINLQCHGARCKESSLIELIESRRIRSPQVGVRFKSFHFLSLQPATKCLCRYIKKWGNDGVDVVIDSVIIV
jgi:hypothetical protein